MQLHSIHRRDYSGGLRMHAHAHALPSMSIVLAGKLRERAGRCSEVALPLSVSFMDADIRHDDEFGPDGATLLSVYLDPADLDADAATENLGWQWLHAGAVVRPFLRLASAAHGEPDADLSSQIIADILATRDASAPARGTPPAWLEDVRSHIDDCHGWPRVAALAETARVHRVYLARQFRRYYGVSVSEYVRRRRVQLATAQLGRRERGLSEIAHGCGFHDHAHLCHAFRAESALSPSAFRRLVSA